MADNYAEIAFTDAVKALQEKHGSRTSYELLQKRTKVDGLTESEEHFISKRDSFYMASYGENGYPYVQHRGGPKGFLKVLTSKRLGVIDFRGNLQYISVGNLATNNNVALIMIDYPARQRLKIFARASIVELEADPALYEALNPGDYQFKPERMIVFYVEAYDWNCPQHITPRYTAEEIEHLFTTQQDRIVQLEAEIRTLKAKLRGTNPA